MAGLLQYQLDEAQTFYVNGAHAATSIMLSSLPEAVLVQVIQERDRALL